MFELLYESDIIYLTIIGIIGLALIILFIALIVGSKKKKKEVELKPINDELTNSEVNKVESNNPILREQIEFPKEEKNIGSVILAMQRDLDKKKEDPVMSFEEEQEEKAIISYHELLKAKQSNTEEFVDELENKIEIIDFPKEPVEEEINIPIKRQSVTETSKFTNTEFISPIYGRMNADSVPVARTRTEVREEPPKENQGTTNSKNDRFLEELKEFRKNL